ncbi:MAG: 1-acyl-sn-glycerol-3-phosphate acyltransferase [Candidatus Gastranaerophilales bacterium]|nr:1-acyl-sn-glycerol-3-phosphate acyltransferase [Candidatus Gastranaerophilales bacterium]
MTRDYQKRDPKEYNFFRSIFQWITCNLVYGLYYRVVFNLRVEGRENVPKCGMFIVASNHVSAIDPFLVVHALQKNVAYMAKIELFQNPWMRYFLDLLGAFAVDRTKLSVSTIKTVLGLKQTNWCLGIFPQGTRERDGNMDNINKGFASFAKTLKCDILPLAITGVTKEKRKLFKGCMKIKIGKPIPYNNNIEEMIKTWSDKIIELSEGRK